jgi:hypothetical protein
MAYIRPRVIRTEYTLPWSPTDRDVLMDRRPVYDPDGGAITGVVERFNMPQELAPILGAGLGWGGDVAGGLTLALCVLDRWLALRPDDTASYYGVPLQCRQLCVSLMPALYLALIRPIGWHGGVIPGGEIARWIAAHRRAWEDDGIDLVDAPI